MNQRMRSTILGLASLASLCSAIAIQYAYVRPAVAIAAWAVTGILFLAWVAMNRAMVLGFFTRKSTRFGASLALVLFLVVGILAFVNVLAVQHSWRKDVTRSGSNTLSPQSVKVLGELSQDVHAYFFDRPEEKEKGEDLFRRYTYISPRVHYEFVDVIKRPTLAQSMGVKRTGVVALTLGNGNKKILVDAPTEEQVTNGLVKLLRSSDLSVYFTVGHDEHSLQGGSDGLDYGELKNELEKQGYTVKELNLFNEGKIPADAAVLVVGGAKKTFFPKELEILANWVKGGGHLLAAMELDLAESGLAKGSRQVAELLKPYGVQVMNQMLVDPTSLTAKVEPQILLGFAAGKDHPITRDFAHSPKSANFLFPLTTYLTHLDTATYAQVPLAITSPNAWAMADWGKVKSGQEIRFQPGQDHPGPMDLAYAVQAVQTDATPKPAAPDAGGKPEAGAKNVRLVVFADSLFVTSTLLDKVGNRDLFLNAVAWLANDERFISIRPKQDADAIKPFAGAVLNLVLLLSVFLMPLFCLGAGLLVWWRRSKL